MRRSILPLVITLHTIPGEPGLESLSPFCMKVECYLKLAKLPYRAVPGSPQKAPKGKLPFIEDAGETIADSSFILRHLEKKHGEPLDGGMTAGERARAHAIQRMLEESLYFVLLWSRWTDDEGWGKTRPRLLKAIPAAVSWLVAPIIRKSAVSQTMKQGIGRHSREEIFEAGERDLDALATLLGDGPFLLGETMRSVDVIAYAFLANIVKFDLDSPLKTTAKSHANLIAFLDRMTAKLAASATPPPPKS